MNPSLLSLYPAVLVPIYSELITNEDLCFLDTAVCSQEHRNKFLDLLTVCYIPDIIEDDGISFTWIVLRGLRVRKLRVICVDPDFDAIFESYHLSYLQVYFYHLLGNLERIRTKIEDVSVIWSNYDNALHLQKVGSIITELIFDDDDDDEFVNLTPFAECCPNLKKIEAHKGQFILPLVDACQLEEINDCHLGSLVKREKCKWTYTCNLKRTSEVDNVTAVCLGEGKYYHMTALRGDGGMTKEDTDMLIPLMPRLTDLSIKGEHSLALVMAAAQKCPHLTKLSVCDPIPLVNLAELLHQSPLLHELYIYFPCPIDDILVVLSESCPLLNTCCLHKCNVASESVLADLFSKCPCLTEFEADEWPEKAVLAFSDSIETLVLCQELTVRKSGRGLRTVQVPDTVDAKVLCDLISQSAGLRTVMIKDMQNCEVSGYIDSFVKMRPRPSSINIVDYET